MFSRALKFVFLLFCSSCLLACTTSQLLHSGGAPGQQSSTWVKQVSVGETLKIKLVTQDVPLKVKVIGINEEILHGETIDQQRIEIPLADIISTEKTKFSWTKTTLLVVGLMLVAAASVVKDGLDEMEDLGCVGSPTCGTPQPSNK